MATSTIDIHKATVHWNGDSQSVDLPAAFLFASDEVYVQRDPRSGNVTLSEKRPKPSWDEVFAAFDAAAAAGETFELEREFCPPRNIEL